MKHIFLWTMEHTGTITVRTLLESCNNCLALICEGSHENLRAQITPYLYNEKRIPDSLLADLNIPILATKSHLFGHFSSQAILKSAKLNEASILLTIRNPINVLISGLKRNENINLEEHIKTWRLIEELANFAFIIQIDSTKEQRIRDLPKLLRTLGLVYGRKTKDFIEEWPQLNSVDNCYAKELLAPYSKMLFQDKVLFDFLSKYYPELTNI